MSYDSLIIPQDCKFISITFAHGKSHDEKPHRIIVRALQDGDTKKYCLYDPNCGESPALTEGELKDQILRTWKAYGLHGGIAISDMEKLVRESGLDGRGAAKYAKEAGKDPAASKAWEEKVARPLDSPSRGAGSGRDSPT